MVKIETLNINGTIAESVELAKMIFSEDFTKKQLDLILAIIAMAKENDNELEYAIPFKEIAKIYNPKNPRSEIVKETVKEAVKGLMKSYFTVRNKEKKYTDYYHWIEKARISDNEETVYIKLSDDVKKFYLDLHKQSLFYSIKNIINLRSLTEARIYHWAYSKKGFKNNVPISVEDAKILFLGREMRTAEFIRAIDTAIARINQKTDLNISYDKVCADKTNNQRITSLNFKIDCTFGKSIKERTPSQIKYDKKRNKELWKRVWELETENNYLSQRNYTLELAEINREHAQMTAEELQYDLFVEDTFEF